MPATKTPVKTAAKPAAQQKVAAPVVPGRQVAMTKTGAIVASNDAFAGMAGQGLEGLSRDDLAIPFLVVLQSGSPQCKRSDGAYLPGATEGMLMNSVTKELIDTQDTDVFVVPCAYERSFIEWKVREDGGGFVMQHDVASGTRLLAETEMDEKSRAILPNGHQLNDTRSFYVMVLDAEGNPSPAFMTMTSTQIKKAKQWLQQQSLLKLKDNTGRPYTPPMFASKWKVTTVGESNDKGSWFGWAFEHDSFFPSVDDPTFQACLGFNAQFKKGEVKAAVEKMVDPDTGEIIGNEAEGGGAKM